MLILLDLLTLKVEFVFDSNLVLFHPNIQMKMCRLIQPHGSMEMYVEIPLRNGWAITYA